MSALGLQGPAFITPHVEWSESFIVEEPSSTFEPFATDIEPGKRGKPTWTDKPIHCPRRRCVNFADNQSLLDCNDS